MKSFIRLLISAVIVGIILPATLIQPARAGVTPTPEFQAGPCPFDLPEGVQEGVDVSCGTFQAPERYEEPDGSTISLAVAVIKAHRPTRSPIQSSSPRADPVDRRSIILPRSCSTVRCAPSAIWFCSTSAVRSILNRL